jgi:glyoxalase family protein
MTLTGIHHVSAITSDTERADRFYSGQLGLTRVKKTVNQDDLRMPHHFWARYDGARVAPHSSWSLFEYPGRWHRVREGAGQTARVAFRADGEESLGRIGESLRSAGVEVSPPGRRGDSRVLAFRDPEGMPLELVA